MVELQYALDRNGRMLHINSVPTGLACQCHCPGCGAPLVAKNNGETISAHFAHTSGVACGGAHESELHMLAKEIISESKCVMLPTYGTVYQGGLVKFDEVEIEKRIDLSSLQPDLCGIVHNKATGQDSRMWIEIKVTHAIGPEKRTLIHKNNISCLEIDLSHFIDIPVTKETLHDFIINDMTQREWTNNPVLEKRRQALASQKRQNIRNYHDIKASIISVNQFEFDERKRNEESLFLLKNKDCCIMQNKYCYKCKHHTTRMALNNEAKRLHLPKWIHDVLSSNLLYWTKDNVRETVTFNKCWTVAFDAYLHNLPLSSPDILGKAVSGREIRNNERCLSFLLDTVPGITATLGMKCKHCVHTFRSQSTRYDIACDMPNVVNRYRRK